MVQVKVSQNQRLLTLSNSDDLLARRGLQQGLLCLLRLGPGLPAKRLDRAETTLATSKTLKAQATTNPQSMKTAGPKCAS